MNLELRRVHLDSASLIQEILESAPNYTRNTEGVENIPSDGIDSLNAIPEGCKHDQKYFMVVYQGDDDIGVVDLIFGFPDHETAFLGLLLLRESHQGTGLGKETYLAVESLVREKGFRKVRLAVVDSNPVQRFWEKLGFRETGVVRSHEGRNLRSTKRVLEKRL